MTGGRDSVCRVWDMRSKVQAHVLSGHEDTVCSILSQASDPQVTFGCVMPRWVGGEMGASFTHTSVHLYLHYICDCDCSSYRHCMWNVVLFGSVGLYSGLKLPVFQVSARQQCFPGFHLFGPSMHTCSICGMQHCPVAYLDAYSQFAVCYVPSTTLKTQWVTALPWVL